jgi:hypothetical protein
VPQFAQCVRTAIGEERNTAGGGPAQRKDAMPGNGGAVVDAEGIGSPLGSDLSNGSLPTYV